MKDTYQTIDAPTEGFFRDRGSKFVAYAWPVDDEKAIQEALAEVRKLHPKARHHCYAYRLGTDGNSFRANDDGEPSGTAGRPILGRIDSQELTNVLIVVVRYFGGTLLGASGLINAYKRSAADALAQATVVEKVIEDIYTLQFSYEHLNTIMQVLGRLHIEQVDHDYGDTATLYIALRQSEVEPHLRSIKAAVADVYLAEVDDLGELPDYSATYKSTR